MDDDIRNIVIAVSVNIASGIVTWIITAKWEYVVVILAASISVFVTISLLNNSYRKVGITKWSPRRGYMKDFRECLEDASSSVDFLASWGGSMPSLSPNMESTFQEMVKHNCQFRFLLLMPGSMGELKRRQARGTWIPGQPETDIRWLLHIKEALGPALSSNFRVALYSEEPNWAIVIIDNKRAIVGFYGKGVGRDNPGLVMEKLKHKVSFFDPFKQVYEDLWSRSKEFYSVKEFENFMIREKVRSPKGFVLAITGPSGGGKTTLSRELIKRGVGVASVTYTTRSPRPDEAKSKQYDYVSKEEFEKMLQAGKFLCHTEFCGSLYGITTKMVFETIDKGNILVMDTIIPPRLLKERLGGQVSIIFVTPSTSRVLLERLNGRDNAPEQLIEERMMNAKEMAEEVEYCDYFVRNDSDLPVVVDTMTYLVNTLSASYRSSHDLFPNELSEFRVMNAISEKGAIIFND